MSVREAWTMRRLVREGDIAGIQALAATHPQVLTNPGNDYYWEAAKAHTVAGDEELQQLLVVLRTLGHRANPKSNAPQALDLFLCQGMVRCAMELLDAGLPVRKPTLHPLRVELMREPGAFDLDRMMQWTQEGMDAQWQALLVAGGVLLGASSQSLARAHRGLGGSHTLVEPLLDWLSLHVVELAEGQPSRLDPREASVQWWVDTAGWAAAGELWTRVAVDHWPSLARFKAMADQAILAQDTPRCAPGSIRARI